MSYILEALKKVEEKREQEKQQIIFGGPGRSAPSGKKHSYWPYLLGAALLCNVVLLIWLMGIWRSEPQDVTAGATAEPAKVVRQLPPAEKLPSPVVQQPAKALPVQSTQSQAAPRVEAREVPRQAVPEKPPAKTAEKEPRPAAEPTPQKVPPPPQPQRLYRYSELPGSLKSSLPDFKISGHAYSPDRYTRVARVNDVIVQEGVELAPGLKVEEITVDGIIFSSQGYRFLVATTGAR